jgi:mitotic spindle assembly checkpoint protein MAD2
MFFRVKKYGLNMMVSLDDQVKAYVKKIMSQLNKWIQKSKISKLVIVITSKETGEHLERWQFDVCVNSRAQRGHHADISRSTSSTTRASQRKSPLLKARRTL